RIYYNLVSFHQKLIGKQRKECDEIIIAAYQLREGFLVNLYYCKKTNARCTAYIGHFFKQIR
ncbi:hypothetical protein D6V63_21390, partial [Escherichia coli]|nr:hypothetical protein [Escherichia coli]